VNEAARPVEPDPPAAAEVHRRRLIDAGEAAAALDGWLREFTPCPVQVSYGWAARALAG
jgi:hypothetical protein